jgi:hypothetical protein
MQFQCGKCKELFHYPAKTLKPIDPQSGSLSFISNVIETHVCPFCQSKTFTEYVEPVEVEQVENVYVYELGSGPQTVLDGLLAQGYRIVNRYAKAYHLEKPTMQHIQPATESQDKLVNAAPIVMRQEKDYISEALETAAAAVEKAKQP